MSTDSPSNIPSHLMLTYDLMDKIDAGDFDEMKQRYINDIIQIKWPHTYKNDAATNERVLEVKLSCIYYWFK